MENDSIFAKIVRREIPAFIVAEDESHLAFLDIFPTHKAQTLVIPKKFTTAKFSEADPALVSSTLAFAQTVARTIEQKIPGVLRCQVVIEGFEVDYFHVKLFPAYILPKDSVHHGTEVRASDTDLLILQKLLRP